ncbi:MAG: hypothetical protein GY898_15810 [Proteobacteria bacterium]|nr:hypothetical protein [Pseudomonadota bacterium]
MTRIALLLSCLALLTGCPESLGQSTFEADPDIAVNVRNPDGPVTITGIADASTAVVSWTIHAGEEPATAEDATIEFSGEGDRLNVTVTPSADNIWVDLQITVPQGASYEVDTGAGDVILDGLLGGGSVVTTTGFVSGQRLAGSLDVGVDEGEIALGMTIDDGAAIAAIVGVGPIAMFLPPDSDALLSADTGDGEVIIDPEVPFSGTNVAGSASGELGAGATATLTLQTNAGMIEISAN